MIAPTPPVPLWVVVIAFDGETDRVTTTPMPLARAHAFAVRLNRLPGVNASIRPANDQGAERE